MAKSKKYYVVWQGNEPGIYDSWPACQAQIKGYPGARYKAFKTREAAEDAFLGGAPSIVQGAKSKKSAAKPRLDDLSSSVRAQINWDSISVDAACSGNPGKMEYQGVITSTGERLFHLAFPLGTNNIGEFLALVHGLAYLKQQGSKQAIYTDSRNAMKWIVQKKCRTTLKHSASTAKLWEVIRRAEAWLAKNTYTTEILKWDTENWGEIPADFGRK